jgi:hypothetical protein
MNARAMELPGFNRARFASKINMRNDPRNQLTGGDGTQKKRRSGDGYYILFLAVLGLYANAAVYGFQYPAGADYNLFLPMANWLRDPSLYPGDAIRDAFPHIQTFYWQVVAILSKQYSAEHILFTLFLITKLIFFGSIGLLVSCPGDFVNTDSALRVGVGPAERSSRFGISADVPA